MRTNDDKMEGKGVKGQRGRGKKCKKLRKRRSLTQIS